MSEPRLREPSVEERELGYHAARFADQEAAKKPHVRERCEDCAFRFGTQPNTYGPTVMNAMKCALEREPFLCHHKDERGELPICAGYALMVDPGAEPRVALWDFCGEPVSSSPEEAQ